MNFFEEIKKSLKKCDMSDSYCDKCYYKEKYPNACIKDLHHDAWHLVKEEYEAMEFYSKQLEELQKKNV